MSKFKVGDIVIVPKTNLCSALINKGTSLKVICDYTTYFDAMEENGGVWAFDFKEWEKAENENQLKNIIKEDVVNMPKHYQSKTGKIQAIEVIEEFSLGYNLGNVVKYVLRAGKKDPAKHIEDLRKSVFYLQREIKNLERQEK